MKLRALTVRGWRNLASGEIAPGPKVTVFSGPNGQGKTNVIEAVHFLAVFRSFRTRAVDDLVAWNGEGAKLVADIETGGLAHRLEATLTRERKTITLDGKNVRRDADALRGVAVVLFVPEDLLLPRAAPSERRRFIDAAVFARERPYYREALAYQRALKSRNAVLKNRGDATLLAAYDEPLAAAGARILLRRRALVRDLAAPFRSVFARIHDALEPDITYASAPEVAGVPDDETQLRAALLEAFAARRVRDRARGFTGFGPHTDDLAIALKGRPAREHASQGQMRSLVLALKLAELELVRDALGEPPLLLLDDVASELDEHRRSRLFETIAAFDGQCFITMTDRTALPSLPERVDFLVEGGRTFCLYDPRPE